MIKLSVSMIVKNEQACLEKCLESIKGVDEIVIVDTGSTDKTGEIARKYTSRYFENEFKWNDNFADARNHALKKCTGDWVLSIDADEYLEKGGIEKIRKAIEKSNGFRIINCNMVAVRGGDSFFYPRVFKNIPEIKWEGAIHNFLNISENNPHDIKIYYGYSEAHMKDPDRSFRILKKEVETRPECIREKYYFAREYWYKGDYVKALYWFQEYVKVGFWGPELSDAWLMIARCLWVLRRGEEARSACMNAIKINADFKEALLFMAEMSGPKNKVIWTKYAQHAKSEDVLFRRIE